MVCKVLDMNVSCALLGSGVLSSVFFSCAFGTGIVLYCTVVVVVVELYIYVPPSFPTSSHTHTHTHSAQKKFKRKPRVLIYDTIFFPAYAIHTQEKGKKRCLGLPVSPPLVFVLPQCVKDTIICFGGSACGEFLWR